MQGFDIVNKVYTRLQKPSDLALPFQSILDAASEVVASKKLDLTLADQNVETKWTGWFTPDGNDFTIDADIYLPLRVERREYNSALAGVEIPIVGFEADADYGVSFYGSKMAFRGRGDYPYYGGEYRIAYEPDFDTEDFTAASETKLPAFFAGMVADETEFKVIDQVEDASPEWMQFVVMRNKKLPLLIADWNGRWQQYVRKFRGKGRIVKRTIFDRRVRRPRFY